MTEENKDLIAYCGLYCGDCFGYKLTVSEAAKSLRRELRTAKFGFLLVHSFGHHPPQVLILQIHPSWALGLVVFQAGIKIKFLSFFPRFFLSLLKPFYQKIQSPVLQLL